MGSVFNNIRRLREEPARTCREPSPPFPHLMIANIKVAPGALELLADLQTTELQPLREKKRQFWRPDSMASRPYLALCPPTPISRNSSSQRGDNLIPPLAHDSSPLAVTLTPPIFSSHPIGHFYLSTFLPFH